MTKNTNIDLPKQDYLIIELAIKENENLVKLGENDLIFMTVKKHASNEEVKFQKSLGNGITFNENTQKYEIEINSNDTKDLEMGVDYGYDITIFYDSDKPKQKLIGRLRIGKKYTLNEVK